MESNHTTTCPKDNSQPKPIVTNTVVNYFKHILDVISLFMKYMKTAKVMFVVELSHGKITIRYYFWLFLLKYYSECY